MTPKRITVFLYAVELTVDSLGMRDDPLVMTTAGLELCLAPSPISGRGEWLKSERVPVASELINNAHLPKPPENPATQLAQLLKDTW